MMMMMLMLTMPLGHAGIGDIPSGPALGRRLHPTTSHTTNKHIARTNKQRKTVEHQKKEMQEILQHNHQSQEKTQAATVGWAEFIR